MYDVCAGRSAEATLTSWTVIALHTWICEIGLIFFPLFSGYQSSLTPITSSSRGTAGRWLPWQSRQPIISSTRHLVTRFIAYKLRIMSFSLPLRDQSFSSFMLWETSSQKCPGHPECFPRRCVLHLVVVHSKKGRSASAEQRKIKEKTNKRRYWSHFFLHMIH